MLLFQYRMVKEALSERANLIQIAPHLAYPFPIMLPIYKLVFFTFDILEQNSNDASDYYMYLFIDKEFHLYFVSIL